MMKGWGDRLFAAAATSAAALTLALMAGCDPAWVAAQHGHSVVTMLRSYAKWLPKGDDNRNLNKLNTAMGHAVPAAMKTK